jgi:GntR family transcriptional regulator
MNSGFDEKQPIFQQVADMIEDDILTGIYGAEEQIFSTAQVSKTFQINPATVVKGVSLLVNEGILYKKRGLGMYVAPEARKIILDKRRYRFYNELVLKLLEEAGKLGLTTEDLIDMIQQKRS